LTVAPSTADTSFEVLWPRVEPHTLLGRHKARSLHELVASVPPHLDVAECGVFRGGMTLMMALQSAERRVWAFDSFEGLPSERIPAETCYYQPGALRAEESCVQRLLAEHGVAERVLIRRGLFESTLDSPEIPTLGLAHVDCDVYSSARTCIERLYDRLAPGGIMIFDDYFDLGGGVSTAVNELLLRTGELLYAGPVEQAFIVKGRRPSDNPDEYVGWRPRADRPRADRPRADRPRADRPRADRPRADRPRADRPRADRPRADRPRADRPVNRSVSFFGNTETIWPDKVVLDVSAIIRDQQYLSDLATGAAVPDLPGGSLSKAKEHAESLLRACDSIRSNPKAEVAVASGMPGVTLPRIRQYAERILRVCDYHQSVIFWGIRRSQEKA